MKKILWYKSTCNQQYPNCLSTIVFAMFMANLHVPYQGRCFDVGPLTSETYFVAVLVNMCIGFVLIRLTIRSTSYLDIYYPWNKKHQERMKRQILLGFFMPIQFTILITVLYFVLADIKIQGNCYFTRYIHQIILMSVGLNVYLFCYRSKFDKSRKNVPKVNLRPTIEINPELYKDLACIYIEDKNYFSISFKGEKMGWNYTLSESMLFLPSTDFYPIKHSFIVNRSAILKMDVINSKKTKILLIAPINLEIQISQRVNACFKRWYSDKKILQK